MLRGIQVLYEIMESRKSLRVWLQRIQITGWVLLTISFPGLFVDIWKDISGYIARSHLVQYIEIYCFVPSCYLMLAGFVAIFASTFFIVLLEIFAETRDRR